MILTTLAHYAALSKIDKDDKFLSEWYIFWYPKARKPYQHGKKLPEVMIEIAVDEYKAETKFFKNVLTYVWIAIACCLPLHYIAVPNFCKNLSTTFSQPLF